MSGSNRNAQVSIEFLMATSLILIIFMIMGFVIYQKYVAVTDIKIDIAGRHIANIIAGNINEISGAGDGYSQYLNLPAGIYGNSYVVEFYKDEPTVFVRSEMTWSAPLFTTKINCNMAICSTSGGKIVMNINNSTMVKVINRNETIYLDAL